ncbi:hypothetical protein [Microcella sp.]|uniref:hypothetical protein n=1 Tax=Microcella sp. TaxID=1913979 RepID=UPI00255ED38E|nr:hypothetical protein [Microcella sp.]MBX9472429.1 hypothetical protein [Microcella sp.]
MASAVALVAGLAMMPGTEQVAVAAPVEPVDILLDEEREAPLVEALDYVAPLPTFPEGRFDIDEPVLLSEDVIKKAAGVRASAEDDLLAQAEGLPVVERDVIRPGFNACPVSCPTRSPAGVILGQRRRTARLNHTGF